MVSAPCLRILLLNFSTEPIEKAKYIEVPFEIEAETGKEARQKIMEFYKQWEWVPGTFRVDY